MHPAGRARKSTRAVRVTRMLSTVAVALGVAAPGVLAITPAKAAPVAAVTADTVDSTNTALPFDLPSPSVLRKTSKLVFAHYYSPMPISLDNKASDVDFYTRNYQNPNGLGGTSVAFGGVTRDRPLQRPVRTDTNWRQKDLETEVRQAISDGVDGFTLDILQIPGDADVQVWKTALTMMDAAQAVDPGFKVAIHLDMTGGMRRKSVDQLAAATAQLGAYKSAYHLADGRLLVAAGMAEVHDAAWWANWKNVMATKYNTPVAFIAEFVASEKPYLPSFAPISYALSVWGARNPAWNNPATTGPVGRANAAHALGTKWMQPVSVQDERPRSSIFDEAENTTNLRNTWKIAMDSNSEIVQIPTWNDYTEGAQIAPSAMHGWSFLDISSYYSTWYKTGSAPRITRDTVYVTHRTQLAAAKPTFPQTKLMSNRGGSPTRDTVEALTFLTAPATVTIHVGSKSYTCEAAAGIDTCTVPLGTGTVSAEVSRDNAMVTKVTSPHTVTATPYVQDLQYVAASSRREGTSATTPPTATPVPGADTIAPSTPAAPATTVTGAEVKVAWPAATDNVSVAGYEVHRSSSSTFTPSATSLLTSVAGTSYVDSGRTPGTWYYRVLAKDGAGNRSVASAAGRAVVTDTVKPVAPLTTTATVTSGTGSVHISWSAATDNVGVVGYRVHRSTTAGFTPGTATVAARLGATTSWDDTRAPGTYHYRVIGFDAAGNTSPAGPETTVVVSDSAAPSAPGNTTASVTGTTVSLNWSAATDAVGVDHYTVVRSSNASLTGAVNVTSTQAATTTETNVPSGTWYYGVRATDAAGNISAVTITSPVVVAANSTTVAVTPIADTYANQGAPATNFAKESSLSSRGSIGSISYLQFAVPATPAGTTLASAVLRLHTTTDTFAGSAEVHTVKLVSGAWNESNVTWNSRPAVSDTVVGSFAAGSQSDAVVSSTLNPALVSSLAGGSGSFAISNSGTDSLWFWSSNHQTSDLRPVLLLTYK